MDYNKWSSGIFYAVVWLGLWIIFFTFFYSIFSRIEPKEKPEPEAVEYIEPVETEVTEVTEVTEEESEVVALETEVVLLSCTVVQNSEPTYSEADLEMLALVIYQEAGSDACTDTVRQMVGEVVMNRVADDRFPNTIEGVLLQERQYGRLHWTGLVWPERAGYSTEAHAVQRAYRCAERVLSGERLLPKDAVWQAEFTQGTEVVAHQDGFYFCR